MKKFSIVMIVIFFFMNVSGCKNEQASEKKSSCIENPMTDGCQRSNGNVVSSSPQTWDMNDKSTTR
jgi:hypothetical protein